MQTCLSQNLKNLSKIQNTKNICSRLNFCPECETLLEIINWGKPSLNCPKCGFKKMLKYNEMAKLNICRGRPGEIAVIDENTESFLRPVSTVRVFCPTCGKDESESWIVSVGGEDAPSNVTFFRCFKCGTTRRETG